MKSLFESGRFKLVEIIRTGKKQTPSNLILHGFDLDDGNPTRIIAAESGTVAFAGRLDDCRNRHYGVHVRIRSDSDPSREIIYYGMAVKRVKTGESVRKGTPIGYSDEGRLCVEVRYNGRRVDALAELGIPAVIGEPFSVGSPILLPTRR